MPRLASLPGTLQTALRIPALASDVPRSYYLEQLVAAARLEIVGKVYVDGDKELHGAG